MTSPLSGPGSEPAPPPSGPAPVRRYDELARRLAHLPEQLGSSALPVLRAALSHPDPWVRRHAVAALAHVDDDNGRAALVAALHDESFGVHWAAAHALAAAGRPGVVAVLRAMLHDTLSAGFLHAAAHVFMQAAVAPEDRAATAPVLDALRHPAPDLEAAVLAAEALQRLGPREAVPEPQRKAVAWYLGRPRRSQGYIPTPSGRIAIQRR